MSERLTDNFTLFRLRVRYGKRDRLKYLGHLELIHTIERIVRRAGLPYAVTQGFSPHMRVGFSSALPVGTSSTCEWYDLFMTEFVALDEAFERLAAASPADLAPIEAAYIDVRTPALTAQLTRLSYRIDLHLNPEAPVSVDEVRAAIDTLRAGHGIDYARGKKSKRLDLDHTLVDYELATGECEDHLVLMLDTHADNEGSMRPEILHRYARPRDHLLLRCRASESSMRGRRGPTRQPHTCANLWICSTYSLTGVFSPATIFGCCTN